MSLVQEVIADQAKQHSASQATDTFVSKKGKLGNVNHLSKQNTLNAILQEAEPNWQQLLL